MPDASQKGRANLRFHRACTPPTAANRSHAARVSELFLPNGASARQASTGTPGGWEQGKVKSQNAEFRNSEF